MYFPESMNFQYFFFDTYIGYFLEALPFALIAGAIYGLIKFRKDRETPIGRKILSCAFVCYITGLICLVIGLDLMRIFWYSLFYHRYSGITIHWLGGSFNIVPNFFNNLNGETIGNFLMFLPFGILYPLSQKEPTWKKSVIVGIITVAVIEVLQPVFGRALDINDIILNTMGIVVSASAFFGIKKAVRK